MIDSLVHDEMRLFGDAADRIPFQVQSDFTPDPARVRQRIVAILETARAAPATSWPDKKQRVWRIMFPNMAKWLPNDERNHLCFEFAREIERLKLAA